MFDCFRFRRLCETREDRPLTDSEDRFMALHRTGCDRCRNHEVATSSSLNMLRSVTLSPEPDNGYDLQLVRMIRLDRARDGFAYWSPALIGAAIASFAFFALMQIVTASHTLPTKSPDATGARNESPPLLLRQLR